MFSFILYALMRQRGVGWKVKPWEQLLWNL